MWLRFTTTFSILGLALAMFAGCSDTAAISEEQQAWLEEYGAEGPFPTTGPQVRPTAPVVQALRQPGIMTITSSGKSRTNGPTSPTKRALPGLQSGLDWDEKFAVWLESLEVVEQPDSPTRKTFPRTTPEGQRLVAPVLECAEVAIFLRATLGLVRLSIPRLRRWEAHLRATWVPNHEGRWQCPRFRTRYRDTPREGPRARPGLVDERLRAWPVRRR